MTGVFHATQVFSQPKMRLVSIFNRFNVRKITTNTTNNKQLWSRIRTGLNQTYTLLKSDVFRIVSDLFVVSEKWSKKILKKMFEFVRQSFCCALAAPGAWWPWRGACPPLSFVLVANERTSCSSTTRRTWPSSGAPVRITTWRTTKTVRPLLAHSNAHFCLICPRSFPPM